MNRPFRLALAQTICRPMPPLISQKVRQLLYPHTMAIEDSYRCTVRGITGSSTSVTTADIHGSPFAVHGYYNWRNTAVARAILSPGDTVIEIGANIGTETVGLSDIVGSGGSAIAFEPLHSNLQALEHAREAAINGNIRIFPWAISDENAVLRFEHPPAFKSGMGRLVRDEESSGAGHSDVDCRTLDSLADELGHASALFIDTEGEEMRVLRGGRVYISRYRPFIVIEASEKNLRRSGFSLNDLYNELRGLEYTIHEIGAIGLCDASPATTSGVHDWFCHPRSRDDAARKVSRTILASALLPCIPGIHPLKRLQKTRRRSRLR